MIRARLAASLAFNVVLALWILLDARARQARKPLFAAALGLLWGPLGLGFWLSDRPLAAHERRTGGGGWTFALGFLLGWTAMLPAIVVLAHAAMADRVNVAGSVAGRLGALPAALLAAMMLWGIPALLAVAIGRAVRRPGSESTTSPAAPARGVPATAAAAAAGLASLIGALLMT
ncbi:MAG TPA: hypothetical protein VF198_01760 [Vicinamibacterales bacterium]